MKAGLGCPAAIMAEGTNTKLEERIDKIGFCLLELRKRLDQMGYEFREPETVLPGPGAEVEEVLERIQAEAGPIPRALQLFYRNIGSVDFTGEHPEWEGCEYPDPVVVFPVTVALQELDDFLADREGYVNAFGSFRIPIAPDYYHKADTSGGMWYGVAVPGATEDPPLLEEWHETTFVRYLEIAIRWGGFPGLERCAGQHNWPVAELSRRMGISS